VVVEQALAAVTDGQADSIEALLDADLRARQAASSAISSLSNG
jgi:hypothetical protein